MKRVDLASYRDAATLTSLLRIVLILFIVASLYSTFSDLMEIAVLQRVVAGDDAATTEQAASDARMAVVTIFDRLLFLTSGIAFLVWTYRMHTNATALGGSDYMEFTAGWAVGWYFIPIANLWKPYQALREIAQASHPDYDDWLHAPRPAILPMWWALVLANLMLTRTAYAVYRDADSPSGYLSAARMSVLTDLLHVALGIVTVLVVNKLYRWQVEKRERCARTAV